MSEQRWDVATYARDAAFVPAFGADLVTWLAPQPGERVLDLGCGDGVLTATIAATGAHVVGVDGSEAFVHAARAKGLDVRFGDAHELRFEHEFEAVFSNAALHWMLEPERVIAGVARALVPGGRFVGEMGGAGNVAAIVTAVRETLAERGVPEASPFPWFFPGEGEYAALLRAGGFAIDRIELFARPTPLPTGMHAWLSTFGQPFFATLTGSDLAAAMDAVVARLAPSLCDVSGTWTADYVRLRFSARLAT